MPDILTPLEQLFELNKEAYKCLNTLKNPLTVIGGQAVSYWVNYYEYFLSHTYNIEAMHSVDIDYLSKKMDIKLINEAWNTELYYSNDEPPPSLAKILLKDAK